MCGGPIEECTNPDNEFKWVGTGPVRCHRGTATAEHQDRFFSLGSVEPKHPEALMWGNKYR